MDFNFIATLIILGVTLLTGVGIFIYFKQKKYETHDVISEMLNQLRKEIQEGNFRMHEQSLKHFTVTHSSYQQQFDRTMKMMEDVSTKLATLDQTNKQVLDFSSQLQKLQSILQNPKQRGVLGEYWLERILANILPPECYQMQYQIGKDEASDSQLIADAVIFVRDQIIPVDAKFSLENYNRLINEETKEARERFEKELKADVKRRIDETAKYIRPQDGTMDFAFMFIPAEGVYYHLLNAAVGSTINSSNLIDYGFSKKVMIVSPTSFFAYLQTVLLGLRGLQMEKSTQEIIKRVKLLQNHLNQFADLYQRLGKNLTTVVSQYNQASNEMEKIDKDVYKLTDGESGGEINALLEKVEKPTVEF